LQNAGKAMNKNGKSGNRLDELMMAQVLEIAERGRETVSPNPMVGALITRRDKIISEGYHRFSGGDHAEIIALAGAGRRAKGATLYCNLEPCTHFGKTGPCVDAVIKAGIERVVLAMKDPNPINRGRGINIMKKAGIEVRCGVLEPQARKLNRCFEKFITVGMPYVTVKLAQTLDGRIADGKGNSKWISGKRARKAVHCLRREKDAVMVGAKTLLNDDPMLTARTGGGFKRPYRIVVSTELDIPISSRILREPDKVIIAGGEGAPVYRKRRLEKRGARVILLPRKDGRTSLRRLMRSLAKMDITSVLCEGGGELFGSLLAEGVVDEALFFMAPLILCGRDSISSCSGRASSLVSAYRFRETQVERIGRDILIRGTL